MSVMMSIVEKGGEYSAHYHRLARCLVEKCCNMHGMYTRRQKLEESSLSEESRSQSKYSVSQLCISLNVAMH